MEGIYLLERGIFLRLVEREEEEGGWRGGCTYLHPDRTTKATPNIDSR